MRGGRAREGIEGRGEEEGVECSAMGEAKVNEIEDPRSRFLRGSVCLRDRNAGEPAPASLFLVERPSFPPPRPRSKSHSLGSGVVLCELAVDGLRQGVVGVEEDDSKERRAE